MADFTFGVDCHPCNHHLIGSRCYFGRYRSENSLGGPGCREFIESTIFVGRSVGRLRRFRRYLNGPQLSLAFRRAPAPNESRDGNCETEQPGHDLLTPSCPRRFPADSRPLCLESRIIGSRRIRRCLVGGKPARFIPRIRTPSGALLPR